MATTFRNQVESINACAAHFALRGYHVETTFYPDKMGSVCTIFFYEKEKRERIARALRCFADQEDAIEFRESQMNLRRKFYTLRLIKDIVL